LPFLVRRQRVSRLSREEGSGLRISIPHVAVISECGEVTRASLNDMIRQALAASASRPAALELFDETGQRLLFARDRQIYAAAEAAGGQLSPTPVRDFLLGAARMNFPHAVLYELNTRLLHSLLVVTQKKPALRVATNMVDLDEILDRIEKEGKSCVVAAARDSFLALLRYDKGAATAYGHARLAAVPGENTLREEFLVRVYTQAAAAPLTVSLYEDFMVSFAPDAKSIPEGFTGRYEDLFLSRPPVVVLRFKEREIGRWDMDRPKLRIGRTPDNDIVIDNLAVSRLHALIEEDRGNYFVRDCDSLNGTEVNGERIARHRLADGDEITIAKHTIVFRAQAGHAVLPQAESRAGFDQTMIFSRGGGTPLHGPAPAPAPAPAGGPGDSAVAVAVRTPRLLVPGEYGTRVIEITDMPVIIGSDAAADIRIEGMFVAGRHAEIVHRDGRVVLRRLGGLRPVRVRGRAVREAELGDGDEIQIGNDSFVYHEQND
jgi:pSer/pThr/pTyr-binding forkhead associated (FHA) protein